MYMCIKMFVYIEINVSTHTYFLIIKYMYYCHRFFNFCDNYLKNNHIFFNNFIMLNFFLFKKVLRIYNYSD